MMALPASVVTGTVVGTFLDLEGEPIDAATITFRPSPARLLVTGEPATLLPGVVRAATNSQGVLIDANDQPGVTLVATDNETIEPTDWTWTVTLDFGARQWGPGHYQVSFLLPGGTTIDLTTVTPVPASNGTFIPGNGVTESTLDLVDLYEGA